MSAYCLQASLVNQVSAAHGLTYEQDAIQDHLQRHSTSLISKEHFDHKGLVPNLVTRNLMSDLGS